MLWSAVKCFGGLRNFTWLPISTGVSRWWFNEIIFWVNWSFKVTDWSAEDDYAPQTLQQYLCKKAQNALLKDTDFHDGASKTSFGRRRCLLPTRLFLKNRHHVWRRLLWLLSDLHLWSTRWNVTLLFLSRCDTLPPPPGGDKAAQTFKVAARDWVIKRHI